MGKAKGTDSAQGVQGQVLVALAPLLVPLIGEADEASKAWTASAQHSKDALPVVQRAHALLAQEIQGASERRVLPAKEGLLNFLARVQDVKFIAEQLRIHVRNAVSDLLTDPRAWIELIIDQRARAAELKKRKEQGAAKPV